MFLSDHEGVLAVVQQLQHEDGCQESCQDDHEINVHRNIEHASDKQLTCLYLSKKHQGHWLGFHQLLQLSFQQRDVHVVQGGELFKLIETPVDEEDSNAVGNKTNPDAGEDVGPSSEPGQLVLCHQGTRKDDHEDHHEQNRSHHQGCHVLSNQTAIECA